MIFEIISGGEKTDWVGKEWAGLFFPRGRAFPGEKTDWGEIPACYTGNTRKYQQIDVYIYQCVQNRDFCNIIGAKYSSYNVACMLGLF